jgi:hypothetical protein
MGTACSTHGAKGNNAYSYKVLLRYPEGKRPLGGSRRSWEDNIKMDLRKIEWVSVDWIDPAQGRDQWKVSMNTVMNSLVP